MLKKREGARNGGRADGWGPVQQKKKAIVEPEK